MSIPSQKCKKLYHQVTEHVDDGYQARTRGQHSLSRVLWTPIREESGNCFCFEIKREKLCKLFDKKRAGSDRDAFEESVRKFPALIIDLSRRTLVSLIKGLW